MNGTDTHKRCPTTQVRVRGTRAQSSRRCTSHQQESAGRLVTRTEVHTHGPNFSPRRVCGSRYLTSLQGTQTPQTGQTSTEGGLTWSGVRRLPGVGHVERRLLDQRWGVHAPPDKEAGPTAEEHPHHEEEPAGEHSGEVAGPGSEASDVGIANRKRRCRGPRGSAPGSSGWPSPDTSARTCLGGGPPGERRSLSELSVSECSKGLCHHLLSVALTSTQ